MKAEIYERERDWADAMARTERHRADYWLGYRRGIRRAYYGKLFGSDAEHTLWLALIDSTDRTHIERGRGYRDGLVNVHATPGGRAGIFADAAIERARGR